MCECCGRGADPRSLRYALVPFTVKAFEEVDAPATVNELFRLTPVNRLSFPVVNVWINVLFVR